MENPFDMYICPLRDADCCYCNHRIPHKRSFGCSMKAYCVHKKQYVACVIVEDEEVQEEDSAKQGATL